MKPRGYLINGNFYDENVSDSELDLVTPLYLEEPQLKPLSDEDILDLWVKKNKLNGASDIIEFVREIEERHGIK